MSATQRDELVTDLEPVLSKENARRYKKLHLVDLNEWLKMDVLPKLTVTSKLGSVVLHPTCGCMQTGNDQVMLEVAKSCADEATIPMHWNCCGTAGDRGFLNPELTDGAQLYEQKEVTEREYDGYYSVACTCEINLSQRGQEGIRVHRVPRRGDDAMSAGTGSSRKQKGAQGG